MSTIAEALNSISETWAGLMVAAVWQSTLLAAVIALVAFRLRNASPAVRYWLWQMVAMKLLIGSFWTVLIPLPRWLPEPVSDRFSFPETSKIVRRRESEAAPKVNVPTSSSDVIAALPQGVSNPVRLSVASGLMVAWLVILAIEIALINRQRLRLNRLLERSRRLEDSGLNEQLVEISGRLGLKRVPEPRVVDTVGSPFVCGLRIPLLILPEGLTGSLDADELRQVLLHELTHLKRGDLIWDWIPTLARMLFFFHPVAHWTASRILLERELACDQRALQLSNRDEAGYARMLVRVATLTSFPFRAANSDEPENSPESGLSE